MRTLKPKKSTALNKIIKAERLRITDIARLSGLTRMTINNLQWKQYEPKIGTALRLEKAIGYLSGTDYTVHELFPEYNVKIVKNNYDL